MPNLQKLSVVCLAYGQIIIDDQYLLTANRERYRAHGPRVWEPPGDIIETLASDMHWLGEMLGAKAPGEAASLRFSIPQANLEATTQWFEARDPDVEGSHGLIIRHLAGSWQNDDEPFLLHPGLINAHVTYVGWSHLRVTTPRPGPQPNQMTHFLMRIFEVTPQEKAIAAIKRALDVPHSPLRLVSTDEIKAGCTRDGEKIITAAQHLQDPQHPCEI